MADPYHILIAEDEAKIATLIGNYLHKDGLRTTHVADGNRVLSTLAQTSADLLLLDLMLPGTDGMTICRELRRNSTLPLIMMTARVEEIDRLLGLELGADDYICKPFSPREVVARVRALLRRTYGQPQQNTPFAVDTSAQRILVHGRPLNLTATEFRLLKALVMHPGRVYSRSQLLDIMQTDEAVGDRAVDSHIKHVRRKMEPALPGVNCIHAIYGVGYRFELPPDD